MTGRTDGEPQGGPAQDALAMPVPSEVEAAINQSRNRRGLPLLGEVTPDLFVRAEAARDRLRANLLAR